MESHPTIKPGAKIITISAIDLNHKSNYQDFGRYVEADLAITGDAEATLPELIEAVKKLITPDRRRALEERGAKIAAENQAGRAAQPRTGRHCLGRQPHQHRAPFRRTVGADQERRLVAGVERPLRQLLAHASVEFQQALPIHRRARRRRHRLRRPGGRGRGVWRIKKHGRLTVNIQCDGDLNYAPGVLWTAAHHKIPMLNVMHNNRAYHEERMYLALLGAKYDRDLGRSDIGTALNDPNIDYASIAKGYGLYAEGPITDPKDLGPALKRAIDRVKAGEPALLDVVTQPAE